MDRDRLALSTPEGLTLELSLAGIGSRGIAAIIDGVIQTLTLLAVAFTTGIAFGDGIASLTAALAIIVLYLALIFGYPILFEVFNAGQTPGKSIMKIRVMRSDGGPVTVTASLIRNFLRLIDILPGGYGIGIITVFVSQRNQRLGDMAADTVVVQERKPESVSEQAEKRNTIQNLVGSSAAMEPDASLWDVSQVTEQEVSVIERFLMRRGSMPHREAVRLADQLATRLEPRVSRPKADITPETFLRGVYRAKRDR